MAQESIVGGLFGITPQAYEEQAYNQALERGQSFGTRAGLYASAAQLGRGIGGALGAEDPQLKMISMRNAVFREINPNDPNSIMAGAQRLAQFDPQGANALALEARKAAELIARTAKENQQVNTLKAQEELARTGKKPTKVLEAEALADAKQALSLLDKDTPEYNRQKNIISQIESGQTDVIEIGVANQPNMRQKVIINKQDPNAAYITLGQPYSGLTSSINMPEIKLPTDINALARGYEEAIKDDVNVKNLSFNAKGLINQAATSNNPSAWEAARTQVAKAVGEGKLSNEDIARTGIDPTLIGGVRDWIDKKITGVPDQKTQQALYVVASYLEKNAAQRIAEKRNNRIAMAKQVNPSVDAAAMFPDYSGAAPGAAAAAVPAAGTGKVVDYKDLGRK